jgi:hypothetical protein
VLIIFLGVVTGSIYYLNREKNFIDYRVAERYGISPTEYELLKARKPQSPTPTPSPTPTLSEEWSQELRSQGIKDPISALVLREKIAEARDRARWESDRKVGEENSLELEKLRAETKNLVPTEPTVLSILLFSFIALIVAYTVDRFITIYYPAFNFCWGDYAEEFRKKESVRRFLLVVVLIGVIVSFIGGILANFIKFGK